MCNSHSRKMLNLTKSINELHWLFILFYFTSSDSINIISDIYYIERRFANSKHGLHVKVFWMKTSMIIHMYIKAKYFSNIPEIIWAYCSLPYQVNKESNMPAVWVKRLDMYIIVHRLPKNVDIFPVYISLKKSYRMLPCVLY